MADELTDDLSGQIAGDIAGTIAGAHAALPAVEPVKGLVPAGVLAMARKYAAKAMSSVGIVLRPAEVQDETGRMVKMYQGVPELRGVRCEVQKPQRQRVGEMAERQTPTHDALITFPWNTDVRAKDLVQANGQVYEVVETDAARSETQFLSCPCVRDTEQREGLFV